MTVRISVAKPSDRDVLLCMQRVCLPYDDLVDPKQGEWLIGRTSAGTPVCFSGGYAYRGEGEAAFVVSRQGVIPALRGLKLQQRLLRETCKRAVVAGLPEVWSYTSNANVASSNSFIGAGFKLWTPTHWNDPTRVVESGDARFAAPASMHFHYWRKRVIK